MPKMRGVRSVYEGDSSVYGNKPSKQYSGVRHCVVCGTKLSRYNPTSDLCWTHAGHNPPPHRVSPSGRPY